MWNIIDELKDCHVDRRLCSYCMYRPVCPLNDEVIVKTNHTIIQEGDSRKEYDLYISSQRENF